MILISVLGLIVLFIFIIGLVFTLLKYREKIKTLQATFNEIELLHDTAPYGYFAFGPQGFFIQMNTTLLQWLSYTREEIIGKMKLSDILTPSSHKLLETELVNIPNRNRLNSQECEFLCKGGAKLKGIIDLKAIHDNSGQCLMSYGSIVNMTERLHYEKKIQDLIHQDALTGLPNRQFLVDLIKQELEKVEKSHLLLAVMFLDLDKFKNINDRFGHDVGDEILKTMAVRLSALVRDTDIVARSGGDEFVIVLPEINQQTDAALIAKKIIEGLSSTIYAQGYQLNITASIGIALYPFDGMDASELMKRADMALYVAKEAGRNQFYFYLS
jgi:diguanylate cyclase (GGDEF)-like protein/PAS domain S-box-containing protein